MTQILATSAYCRDANLTFAMSDTKATIVREFHPGVYGVDLSATGNHPPVQKVHTAGNHLFGVGGTVEKSEMQLGEEEIAAKISGIAGSGDAYKIFLSHLSGFSGETGSTTTYIFGTFGRTPRFRIGVVKDGEIKNERARDTVALHRNELDDMDCSMDSIFVKKMWLDTAWLKRTYYEGRIFENGYRPMLDAMSMFFVETLKKESEVWGYGVSEGWDTLVEVNGEVLRSGIYRGGINDSAGFLRSAREQILSADDGFLKEVWARVAYGGLIEAGHKAHRRFFPKEYFEETSRSFRIVSRISDEYDGLQRSALHEGTIGDIIEYTQILERFFTGELERVAAEAV